MSFRIIIFICFCVSIGCEPTNLLDDNRVAIQVEFVDAQKDITLEKLISDIQYIPLEDNKNNIHLNIINEILIHKNLFYLECQDRPAIYVYNKEGNFIEEISTTGSGPMEFSSFDCLMSIPHNNHLLALDVMEKKLVEFDNYKVVGEWNFGTNYASSIFYHNDRIFLLTNGTQGGFLKIIDYHTYDELKSGIYGPEYFNSMPSPKPFTLLGDDIYLSAGFTDTIYIIDTENNIIPRYYLNNDENSLQSIEYSPLEMFFSRELRKKHPEMILPQGIISSYDNLLFISDINQKEQIILNTKSNKAFAVKFPSIKNLNLIHRGYFICIMYVDEENYAFTAILPNRDFYTSAQQYVDTHQNYIADSLTNLLDQYPSDSGFENPIIVKLKFNTDYLKNLLE